MNTINPDAEEKAASQERQARLQSARAAETTRGNELDSELNPPAPKPSPAPDGVRPDSPAPSKTATPGGGTPANAKPAAGKDCGAAKTPSRTGNTPAAKTPKKS